MPLILVNSKEVDLLTSLLKQNNQYLRLFVNDYTPVATSGIGDFTEMTTHSYSEKTVTASNWTIITSTIGATAQNIEQTWSFTSDAAVIVYGYYLIDSVSGDLIYAERFPNPQTVENAGDSIKITPKVAIENNLVNAEDLIIPTGSVVDFGGTASPTGWLLCDGSEVSETFYSKLFNVIGTAFNKGDESAGYFRLPDFRGRVSVGTGQGSNLTERNHAFYGGEENHLLTTGELPSHNHTAVANAYKGAGSLTDDPENAVLAQPLTGTNIYVAAPGNTAMESSFVQLQNTGSDASHNNMQPYVAVNKIIKF